MCAAEITDKTKDLTETRDLALALLASAVAASFDIKLPPKQPDTPENMLRQIRFVLSYLAAHT